jgi:glycosyl transferase family 25
MNNIVLALQMSATVLFSTALAATETQKDHFKSLVSQCFELDANRDKVISDKELEPLSTQLGSWAKALELRLVCKHVIQDTYFANLHFQPESAPAFDGFKYYVVNLKHSTRRLSDISEKFRSAKLEFTRIEAVYGKDFDLVKLIQDGIYSPHTSPKRWLNPAEIGCYLSHRKVWEQFLSDSADYAVVLEDDATFDPDFHNKVQALISSAPSNWSVIYLGCNSERRDDFFKPCRAENNNPVSGAPLVELNHHCVAGTGAYVVNRKTAKNLLRNSLPIEWPIDYAIKNQFLKEQHFGDFHAYCSNPEIAHPTGKDSEIGQRGNCKDLNCRNPSTFWQLVFQA